MLEPGTKAPDFQLFNTDGEAVRLSDFLGKKVVVYFYPRDNTTGLSLIHISPFRPLLLLYQNLPFPCASPVFSTIFYSFSSLCLVFPRRIVYSIENGCVSARPASTLRTKYKFHPWLRNFRRLCVSTMNKVVFILWKQ